MLYAAGITMHWLLSCEEDAGARISMNKQLVSTIYLSPLFFYPPILYVLEQTYLLIWSETTVNEVWDIHSVKTIFFRFFWVSRHLLTLNIISILLLINSTLPLTFLFTIVKDTSCWASTWYCMIDIAYQNWSRCFVFQLFFLSII